MKPLVNIAFQGGSHGHFLKYILDRYSSLTPNITQLPFEQDGTSHKELQYSGKFEIYHPIPFDKPIWKDPDLPHVLITIDKEDVVFIERWVNIRANGFNLDMHNLLFTEIKKLKNVKFVMSNAKVDFVMTNFKEYNCEDIIARRSINSKKPESTTTEIIIYN